GDGRAAITPVAGPGWWESDGSSLPAWSARAAAAHHRTSGRVATVAGRPGAAPLRRRRRAVTGPGRPAPRTDRHRPLDVMGHPRSARVGVLDAAIRADPMAGLGCRRLARPAERVG